MTRLISTGRPPAVRARFRAAGAAAFTLVELLIVVAIMATLIGLLLPAVTAAREAARRAACSNNVLQLGLALHNYEFHREAFPAGVTDAAGPIKSQPDGRHVSWIVRILPYLEEQALARHFKEADGAYAIGNAAVVATVIPTLICPSSSASSVEQWREPRVAEPAPDDSLDDLPSEIPQPRRVAVSHYAGSHHDVEAPIAADNHGMLFLNSAVRFKDIEDGSSRTLLLAERVAPPRPPHELDGRDDLGWASGTRATLRNTSVIKSSAYGAAAWGDQQPVDPLFVGGFGSFHMSGICVSAMADGGVRQFTPDIDPDLLRQLGHRADGEIPKDDGGW
jgi:competence protein ComGC